MKLRTTIPEVAKRMRPLATTLFQSNLETVKLFLPFFASCLTQTGNLEPYIALHLQFSLSRTLDVQSVRAADWDLG
jgi:hypothetical protein